MSRLPASFRVFFLAFAIYAFSAQVWAHPTSLVPHYIYLAQALLHGHVDLIQLPPITYDLLQFNGHWFIAESPMPAIMLLPFVAIFGVGFSDVLFSVFLGAIDVALVYSLLGIFLPHPERSLAESMDALYSSTSRRSAQRAYLHTVALSESARRWITLLFAVGTPFWYLTSLGTYWFMAHIVVVFFALLATHEALTNHRWFLVGLWLACAGFARATALCLAPFFLIILLYSSSRSIPLGLVTRHAWRFSPNILRSSELFTIALALGSAAHFVYNYARLKSFTDFGYAYITGANNITSLYVRYGGFNPRFAPCNLAVSLLAPPEVNGAMPAFITQACAYLLEGVKLSDASAFIAPNPLGMSIFLVTPALLMVFTSFKRIRMGGAALLLAAWIGLLATFIPLWLYHNTGSLQFGWRYLLDAAPMWIILLAAGMQKVTRLKQCLILVSIAINLWGFLWMYEKLNGLSWWNF